MWNSVPWQPPLGRVDVGSVSLRPCPVKDGLAGLDYDDPAPGAGMTVMSEVDVLGIFAKRPRSGHVKTRLAAAISPEWAARAAAAFLDDTLDRFAELTVRRVVVFAPSDAEACFAQHGAGRYHLWPQADGDLGARLAAFFRTAFAAGARRAVAIGADSPTLPTDHVVRAFAELDHADVVLGPAFDGGYYLVGCGPNLPPMFDDIPWSTPDVLRATVERLGAGPWRLALLPPWYDVDTPADWLLLRGHVAALRRAGLDPGAPRTEALLTAESAVSA